MFSTRLTGLLWRSVYSARLIFLSMTGGKGADGGLATSSKTQ